MFYKYIVAITTFLAGHAAAASSDLTDRYNRLSCAVVHIQADGSSRTGAFIDGNGRVLTAAHVALDRTYTAKSGSAGFDETITIKKNEKITRSDGSVIDLPTQNFQQTDLDNATTDIAILNTGVKSNCFLKLDADLSSKLQVGNHLIAIGFPGSVPTGVLYEGFLSARHSDMHVLGPVTNSPDKVVQKSYDVMRVQMPITSGASGSPLLADDDSVVGVIVEVPLIALPDVQRIIQAYLMSPQNGSVLIGGFNTNQALAEVAFMVQEYEVSRVGHGCSDFLHPCEPLTSKLLDTGR